MKIYIVFGLLFLIGCSLVSQSEAEDCWNFITGSRCDNEDFWANFGYARCNDECKNRGKSGGRCVKSRETCGGMTRNVNVCKCN